MDDKLSELYDAWKARKSIHDRQRYDASMQGGDAPPNQTGSNSNRISPKRDRLPGFLVTNKFRLRPDQAEFLKQFSPKDQSAMVRRGLDLLLNQTPQDEEIRR